MTLTIVAKLNNIRSAKLAAVKDYLSILQLKAFRQKITTGRSVTPSTSSLKCFWRLRE